MSFAQPPPEFFFDRSLGKETARRLEARGWKVHLIAEEYPNDAQEIADETWLAEGCERGWCLLTKDARIRYRGPELAAMHVGRLFCLANGNLNIEHMVARLLDAEQRIAHAAASGDPGFWKIYEAGRVERRWP